MKQILDLRRVEQSGLVGAIELHEQLPSTSNRALQLAVAGKGPLPLLVLAERQTAGRGRRNNRWWSAPGALTFSLLLDARAAALDTQQWPLLSLATALGVAEAIESLQLPAEAALKWPNDVYLLSRKLCGILVESPATEEPRLVIGVGINVNNSFGDAPADLQTRAVSLRDAVGHDMDLSDVLLRVLRCMFVQWSLLARGELMLESRWARRCLLRHQTVRVEAPGRTSAGRCLGVDDQGALLVQTATGIDRCLAGVVVDYGF